MSAYKDLADAVVQLQHAVRALGTGLELKEVVIAAESKPAIHNAEICLLRDQYWAMNAPHVMDGIRLALPFGLRVNGARVLAQVGSERR